MRPAWPRVPRTLLLVGGLALAVAVRMAIGGVLIKQSAIAGLCFGGLLAIMATAAGTKIDTTKKSVFIGIAGGAVLCLPALLAGNRGAALLPPHQFFIWAAVVAFVAVCEEWFLRGTLYSALEPTGGKAAAIVVPAICFALLHLPLYGVSSLPLNLAVGIYLGVLRLYTGTWAAPAAAHVTADLAAWWLV
jgi:membrane protease YdiL (CAAX protease family)